jgi:phytanoyl-CoA hydroxylase
MVTTPRPVAGEPSQSGAYRENGYVVVRKLISHDAIDRLLDIYRRSVLISPQPFFRQSTNRWTKNRLSRDGYSLDAYRDVHDYPKYPEFCGAVKDILCSTELQKALQAITGSASHNLMQSMLFDQNTATPAHQDWYYLDSMPNGHLLAGWIALEDIHEDAGRFFVVPKSHELPLDPTNSLDINAYIDAVERWFATNASEAHAPALEKGDVLFWSSKTIHGAHPTRDPRRSRKSLTAHYLPAQHAFGLRNATVPVHCDYESWNGMKVRQALKIHKVYSPWARVQTDVFAYLYGRRAFRKLALYVASMLKR